MTLDELLSLVWKKPAFFLAHPKAIAAFGREATRRGVPPATVHLLTARPFITWRGIPLIPSNKLEIDKAEEDQFPASARRRTRPRRRRPAKGGRNGRSRAGPVHPVHGNE